MKCYPTAERLRYTVFNRNRRRKIFTLKAPVLAKVTSTIPLGSGTAGGYSLSHFDGSGNLVRRAKARLGFEKVSDTNGVVHGVLRDF